MSSASRRSAPRRGSSARISSSSAWLVDLFEIRSDSGGARLSGRHHEKPAAHRHQSEAAATGIHKGPATTESIDVSSRLPVLADHTVVRLDEIAERIGRGDFHLQISEEETVDAAQVNAVLGAMAKRMDWYEELLDAIPFPISVTNADMEWTFINAAAEAVSGKKRKEVLGLQCHNWGADICRTERCGIAKLRANEPRSFFRQPGIERDFQVDVAYLREGHIEVVQDVTEMEALRKKSEAAAAEQKAEAEALTRDMKAIVDVLEAVSNGDLSIEHRLDGQGAAQDVANAVERLVSKLQSDVREISEASADLKRLAVSGREQSIRAFESADTTSSRVSAVAETIEGAARAVDLVSKSLDDLSRSIETISSKADDGSKVAGEAVKRAGAADTLVNRLSESSGEIGKVVKVINSIAQQTNLLSLNATIEAARAGEAGKGFSVVAHEVKELAQETSRSTEEISDQVDQIQSASGQTAASISEIGAVISRINHLQAEIRGSVSEQEQSRTNIAQSFEDVVSATTRAGISTQEVVEASALARTVADETNSTASELSRMAERLSGLVSRFQLQRGSDTASSARPPLSSNTATIRQRY